MVHIPFRSHGNSLGCVLNDLRLVEKEKLHSLRAKEGWRNEQICEVTSSVQKGFSEGSSCLDLNIIYIINSKPQL